MSQLSLMSRTKGLIFAYDKVINFRSLPLDIFSCNNILKLYFLQAEDHNQCLSPSSCFSGDFLYLAFSKVTSLSIHTKYGVSACYPFK